MDFHSPIISLSIQPVNSIPQDLPCCTIYTHHINLVVLAANLKNGPYIRLMTHSVSIKAAIPYQTDTTRPLLYTYR